MHLLFSRHGDTFEPGQKVVWVGSRNDPPLASRGKVQARLLADSLKRRNIQLRRIFSAPLARTREYAEIVAGELGFTEPISIDERLSELDFGHWSGLSSEEIVAKFGKQELEGWEKFSQWPKNSGWSGSEKQVVNELRTLVSDCKKEFFEHDTVLFVTSNGRLRFLLKLVPGEFECRIANATFKVKTGNVCLLQSSDEELSVLQWDIAPTSIALKA